MGINLENFNRIIDLEFSPGGASDSAGSSLVKTKSIICPRHGIKPEIEINGTYGAGLSLQAFNITVKNLYIDYRNEQYAKVKVRAGYANNYTTIEADILQMYQDNPGPEATTVIQCILGNITKTWLDSTISLNFDTGSKLTSILENIKSKLLISDMTIGNKARTLILNEPLQFDGSARNALALLEKRFEEDNLQIVMQGSKLCAICLTQGDFVNTRILQYMSAPPQKNPGDAEGNWQTMITAPWLPDLLPGDQLIIPSQLYIYNGALVGGANPTQKMEVTQMSFHFGTRGSTNQMTCQGFIVR